MSDMGALDLTCRCEAPTWIKERFKCRNPATQDDGLCDSCRCPHGCCEDHSNYPDHDACHKAGMAKRLEALNRGT